MIHFDDCDASELVGKQVGPCQVVACVRRGQHTTVYRGWPLRADLEGDVALKIVNPDRLQADVLARFRQEAEFAHKLDHPNIVRVYAAGEQDDQPYLVMEWVEGKSLKEELEARGARWRDAADVGCGDSDFSCARAGEPRAGRSPPGYGPTWRSKGLSLSPPT